MDAIMWVAVGVGILCVIAVSIAVARGWQFSDDYEPVTTWIPVCNPDGSQGLMPVTVMVEKTKAEGKERT